MISFKSMHAIGYASLEDETFDWGLPGLNIIQAPNGSGKTTFINALVWCLYGKPLSGSVEPWEHTRSSSYKGTKVSLWFNINDLDYRVIRYKDYPKFKNSLILEIDGPKPEPGSKPEIQIKINEVLGYSYELFKNSIIFGQKLKRIISETGPNKKQVFDDAFEVTYISKAKKLAGEKHAEFLTEHNLEYHKLVSLHEKVTSKKSEIDSQQQLVDGFEFSKKQEIREWKNLIKDHKKKIKAILKVEDVDKSLKLHRDDLEILEKDSYTNREIIEMEKALTKAEMQSDTIAENIHQTISNMASLEGRIKDMPISCESCGKDYTAIERKNAKRILKDYLKENQKKQQELKDANSILKGQIQEQEGTISSATNTLESIDILVKEINRLEKLKETISQAQEKIDKDKKQIKKIREQKLTNNIDQLRIELLGLQTQVKAQQNVVRRVTKDVNTYDWLVKDPLSNAGLRAFIFNMMLDDINDRLEYYTSFIGFQVAFVMDMKSAHKNLETYVFASGEPVPYGDLSGGQQQAVDIATAFAIHDVVADTKECSLLVMDEVFESLDRDNIEIMAELIQDKAQNKCLYLVTHRMEFNPTNANIIQVEYADGISSLA